MWKLHLDSCPGPTSVRAGREQWLSREGAERGERKHEGQQLCPRLRAPQDRNREGFPRTINKEMLEN